MPVDFPPPPNIYSQPTMECFRMAAVRYQVPLPVLFALRDAERGKSGEILTNKNGTYDHGYMMINTVWLEKFRQWFGIPAPVFTYNACYSIMAAAYIVRYEVNRTGNFWKGVGDYHSRTPSLNRHYRIKVEILAERYQRALQQRELYLAAGNSQ